MKFNIIENPDPFAGVDFDEFKKDCSKLNVRHLCEKYGMNAHKIGKLKKKLSIPKNPQGWQENPKYYYFQQEIQKWHVQRNKVYFGSYTTEEEAKKVVEFLKENNWDKEELRKNKDKILKKEE